MMIEELVDPWSDPRNIKNKLNEVIRALNTIELSSTVTQQTNGKITHCASCGTTDLTKLRNKPLGQVICTKCG